jgi:hypothetical protein
VRRLNICMGLSRLSEPTPRDCGAGAAARFAALS